MDIFGTAFVLLHLYMDVIDGLVYVGFSAVTRKEGVRSLDRYRCAEYIGQVLSPDGSCTAVPYGWTGVVSPDSEYLKKLGIIALFIESTNVVEYRTPIPGEVTAGISIELVFVPKNPWNQIVFNLKDVGETIIALHISFRKDFNKIQFNSMVSGKYSTNENANGVEISSDEEATLKVNVLTTEFKVSVNGKEKHTYQTVLSPSISRMVEFRASSGSHSLLKSICFHNLK